MLCSQSKKTKKKSSKTMRKRKRGEILVSTEIPLDLLIEIVNRLPVKSMVRFKCVSKLWYSLINSKGYLFDSPPRLYISSVKSVLLSLSLTSTRKSSAFDLDSTINGVGGCDMMALRGLILYSLRKQAFIYNPTTGQRVGLPEIFDPQQVDYFLGYDSVLDQYKVACTSLVWLDEHEMFEVQHWVFVLEAGSYWRRIEFDHLYFPQRERVFVNGVIYYLAECLVHRRVVMSFDVRSEEFNMIQIPSEVYQYWDSKCLELIEYGGKPAIFDYTRLWNSSGLVNLWVLEDAGNWSNKSLVLQACHMHFFPVDIYFEVIGTTQKGEVILRPRKMSSPYYVLYYDLHKNDVRRVDIRGISEDSKSPLHLALMDTGESIMHLEV